MAEDVDSVTRAASRAAHTNRRSIPMTFLYVSSVIDRFAARRALGAIRVGDERRSAGVAKPVGDWIAAVAAEVAQRDLDPGRRLTPLVLGHVEHALDPQNRVAVIALGNDIGDRLFAFDQALQDGIEQVVG